MKFARERPYTDARVFLRHALRVMTRYFTVKLKLVECPGFIVDSGE